MSTEDLIQQILQQKPKFPRTQLLEKLEAAKQKTGGLIADATLLRMIAAELQVNLTKSEETPQNHKLSIGQLVSGLNDATVTGRVLAIGSVRTFEGKKPGKFAGATVADSEGVVRVVFWNEKADVVEQGQLKVGQIVRLNHGYTKEDRDGTPEMHLSTKSNVEISPADVKTEDYLSVGKFASKISQIIQANKNVTLNGTVKKVFSASAFNRQDGTAGSVMRFVLVDETGEVTVVAWNEKAQELEPALKENATVQLVNGRIKPTQNGGFEVHVDASTFVDVSAPTKQITKVAGLSEFLGNVNVEGEVVTVPVTKKVQTSKGEAVKLATFELKDETGIVRVSAWRNHADAVEALLMGQKILLENVYAKKGYDGNLELSTRTVTVITRL